MYLLKWISFVLFTIFVTSLAGQFQEIQEEFLYDICLNESIRLEAVAGSGSIIGGIYNWEHLNWESEPSVVTVRPSESTTYSVTVLDSRRLLFIQDHIVRVNDSGECLPTRNYATMEYMNDLLRQNEESLAAQRATEKDIDRLEKYLDRGIYEIPVKIHVLYASSAQNLSREVLDDQIDQINRDFFTAAYTEELAQTGTIYERFYAEKPMSISFCLDDAAISYHKVGSGFWKDFNNIKDERRGVPPIDPDQFLNIWITALPDHISGYAQMPWGPAETDGVVIDYRFIGPGIAQGGYSDGHTLTHLIGNYLGLYPLWGSYPCGDDYVKDTPIHGGPTTYCPVREGILVSPCMPNGISMAGNFMDNTKDRCLEQFTKGQMIRMQAVLGGARKNLGKCGM